MMDAEQERLQQLVLRAAREFNAGRYFEAHEVLEDGLDDVADAWWPLFLGLIQVAVGYHKLANGFDGAARMLDLGLAKLGPFPGDALGLALDALRTRAQRDRDALAADAPQAVLDLHRDPPRLLPAS
jgi:hypothetical protein